MLFALLVGLVVLPSSVGRRGSITEVTGLAPGLRRVGGECTGGRRGRGRTAVRLCGRRNMGPVNSYLPVVLAFMVLFTVVRMICTPLARVSNVSGTAVGRSIAALGGICITTTSLGGSNGAITALRRNASLCRLLVSCRGATGLNRRGIGTMIRSLARFPNLSRCVAGPRGISRRLINRANSHTRLLMISITRSRRCTNVFSGRVISFYSSFSCAFLNTCLNSCPA